MVVTIETSTGLTIYIYIYIYVYMRLGTPGLTLWDVTPLHTFSLKRYFDKSTAGLHYILIPSMLVEYQDDRRPINYLIIKCLNFKSS